MFQKMKIRVLHILPAIVVSVLLVTGVIYAWAEPSVAPSGGNTPAPLNVGSSSQVKQGNLAINQSGSFANALLIPYGNVGIGTGSPLQKLDVQGGYIRSGTGFCIGASCITSWPSSSGTGTVTSVATNNGLTGGPITTSGTIGLNLTGISSCTNSISNKIYWNGSYLACGTDQTGGVGGLSGSGSINYISKWTGPTSLGNSVIYDNGTNVGIGTAGPTSKLTVGDGSSYSNIEVKRGAIHIRDTGYSGSTLQLLARDIRTSNNEDLYLNWDNASGNIVIGGEGERKYLYFAGTNGATGVGSYIDAPDYYIRSTGKWASQIGSVVPGGLYGSCVENGGYVTRSLPPFISGTCTCPSGYTKVSTGVTPPPAYDTPVGYDTITSSCYKN